MDERTRQALEVLVDRARELDLSNAYIRTLNGRLDDTLRGSMDELLIQRDLEGAERVRTQDLELLTDALDDVLLARLPGLLAKLGVTMGGA